MRGISSSGLDCHEVPYEVPYFLKHIQHTLSVVRVLSGQEARGCCTKVGGY